MFHQSLSLSLALGLLLLVPTSIVALSPTNPNDNAFEVKPTPSPASSPGGSPNVRSRPPEGRRKPGGGLSGGNQCPKTPIELTAILPESTQGSTISDQTTFWFYVPYASTDVSVGEFSILNRNGTAIVHEVIFTLPKTPGLVSITLPAKANLLKQNEYYQWFLNLYCAANTSPQPDLKINGWVIRLPDAPKNGVSGTNGTTILPDLWYDKVNDLATQLQQSPQDGKLQQQWAALLKELGLEELSKEPIVGPVILAEERTP